MREAVRKNLSLCTPVDVVLHRGGAYDLEFATLEREVANVFRAIQNVAGKSALERQKRDVQPPGS
jgi:ribonuclease P protein component